MKALLVLAAAWVCLGGELGTRLEVGPLAARGAGWLTLSQDLGKVALVGRAEWDVLPLKFRRATGSLGVSLAPFSFQLETALLASGRLNLAASSSWKGAVVTPLGDLALQAGGKVTVYDVLGARVWGGFGSVTGRMEVGPFWAGTGVDFSFPGGFSPGELRVGWSGPRWGTLTWSDRAASLELGAEEAATSIVTFLSFFPKVSQSLSVTYGGPRLRVQGRLALRAGEPWTSGLTIVARQKPWSLSVGVTLGPHGLERLTTDITLGF